MPRWGGEWLGAVCCQVSRACMHAAFLCTAWHDIIVCPFRWCRSVHLPLCSVKITCASCLLVGAAPSVSMHVHASLCCSGFESVTAPCLCACKSLLLHAGGSYRTYTAPPQPSLLLPASRRVLLQHAAAPAVLDILVCCLKLPQSLAGCCVRLGWQVEARSQQHLLLLRQPLGKEQLKLQVQVALAGRQVDRQTVWGKTGRAIGTQHHVSCECASRHTVQESSEARAAGLAGHDSSNRQPGCC